MENNKPQTEKAESQQLFPIKSQTRSIDLDEEENRLFSEFISDYWPRGACMRFCGLGDRVFTDLNSSERGLVLSAERQFKGKRIQEAISIQKEILQEKIIIDVNIVATKIADSANELTKEGKHFAAGKLWLDLSKMLGMHAAKKQEISQNVKTLVANLGSKELMAVLDQKIMASAASANVGAVPKIAEMPANIVRKAPRDKVLVLGGASKPKITNDKGIEIDTDKIVSIDVLPEK